MRISRQGIETEWHMGCKVIFGLVGACFTISTTIRGLGLAYSLIRSGDRLGVLNQYGFKFGRDLVASVVLRKVAKQFRPPQAPIVVRPDREPIRPERHSVESVASRLCRAPSLYRHRSTGTDYNDLRTAAVDGWLSEITPMRGVNAFLDRLGEKRVSGLDEVFVDVMIRAVQTTLQRLQESKDKEFVQLVLGKWGAIGAKGSLATAQDYGGVVYYAYALVEAHHVATSDKMELRERLEVANRFRLIEVARESTSNWSKFLEVCLAVGDALQFPQQGLLFGKANWEKAGTVFDATGKESTIGWFVDAFQGSSPVLHNSLVSSLSFEFGYQIAQPESLRDAMEKLLAKHGILRALKKDSSAAVSTRAAATDVEWECASCMGEDGEMVRPAGVEGAPWHRGCVLEWVRKKGKNPVNRTPMTVEQVNALPAIVRDEN